ncbi:MAG: Uma2 family endonuclease [Vulcanimicrobiaceae bacterium]
MATELVPRLFSVQEYHRMAEIGILEDGERVELLDGIVVTMSPIGRPHWARHAAIDSYLQDVFPENTTIVGQGSFPLGDRNEPQPDIALVDGIDWEIRECGPAPSDLIALIEIADSSVLKDLGRKQHLYARFGIADYLVVDLGADELVHHTVPHQLGYAQVVRRAHADRFRLARRPEIELAADRFLSRARR